MLLPRSARWYFLAKEGNKEDFAYLNKIRANLEQHKKMIIDEQITPELQRKMLDIIQFMREIVNFPR